MKILKKCERSRLREKEFAAVLGFEPVIKVVEAFDKEAQSGRAQVFERRTHSRRIEDEDG